MTATRIAVDGRVRQDDVVQLELTSARRALSLIKERLPAHVMEELLADDLAEADARWRQWSEASDGSWHGRDVRIAADGVSADEFVAWWARALGDIHGVMYPGYPEHYRFGWVPNPNGAGESFIVIEEVSHEPFRMYCEFGPEWAPHDVTAGFDALSVGVGRLKDGTEVVRLMNEIRPTADGLELKLGFYVGRAVPPSVTDAHVEQQIVEWTRWIGMARSARGDWG
jgi:hypothetical protein